MGAFFTNLHVRNASTQPVCAELPKLAQSCAYVSAQKSGWVTVYPEVTEDQNEKTLDAIASGLSNALKTDVLGLPIAKETPGQLTEIGIGAAIYGLGAFLAALLKRGLDPNAANAQGRTTVCAAEQHGKDSGIYRLVKAAEDRK